MITVKTGSLELGASANLTQCVDLALDLSAARPGEVEVFLDGVKLAGFTAGIRTFPPKRDDNYSILNLARHEAWAIERALHATDGDVPRAAALLGIGYSTLYRKIKESAKGTALAMARAA